MTASTYMVLRRIGTRGAMVNEYLKELPGQRMRWVNSPDKATHYTNYETAENWAEHFQGIVRQSSQQLTFSLSGNSAETQNPTA